MIKINSKFLSIPPFISTTWQKVAALHLEEECLSVLLNSGQTIKIPGLGVSSIEQIFNAHTLFLESQPHPETPQLPALHHLLHQETPKEPPFRMIIGGLEEVTSGMQHNPAQAEMPDLPPEILEKIVTVTKLIAPTGVAISKPEAHCNCVHCQISKALFQQTEDPHSSLNDAPPMQEEEIVTEADLHFPEWDIEKAGEQLYTVINRLDRQEKYTVFLGHPVGCTCGHSDCKHIIAVLKS
jgi:hypothetical protein